MNEQVDRYYRNSGAVPFGGTLLMLFFGVLGAVGGALAYALAAWYNPWPFFLFIATFFYMGLVGYLVSLGMRVGKVRHHGFAAIVGFTMGCLTYSLKWVFWFWAASDYKVISFEPDVVIAQIQFINAIPRWSIFGWAPTGGWQYLFWGIEALIIIGGTTAVATSHDIPFCEYCNCWTKPVQTGVPVLFCPVETDVLAREMEAENYEILTEWFRHQPNPAFCYEALLLQCPKCADSNYLKVVHNTIITDSDGVEQVNQVDVLNYISIPADVIPEMIELNNRPPADETFDEEKLLESPFWDEKGQ